MTPTTIALYNCWVAMRRIALLLIVGSCLALAGCESYQLQECRWANPPGSPGYAACWKAELHRQSEEMDRQRALSFRGKQ